MIIWLLELFRDSLRNLVRHKLRSALTLLGVIFGVASVITMLAIGEGAQRTVLAEIEGLGLKNIIVESVRPPDVSSSTESSSGGSGLLRYGVTQRDVAQIRGALPHLPLTLVKDVKDRVYCGSRRLNVETRGVTPEYFDYFESSLIHGQPLSSFHEREAMPVAVLTEEAAAQLPGIGGAVGKTLKIGPKHFRVIGVVSITTRGNKALVFIPSRTAESQFGDTSIKQEAGRMEFTRNEVGQVVMLAGSESEVPGVAAAVKRIFTKNHVDADYQITVPLDILKSRQRTQQIFNFVLIAIACISLLVGGIGIMNIMLAIVVERIREIGIRRAIGARRFDIFMQFLSEALTMSVLGGILGCLLGIGMCPVATAWTGWPAIINLRAILLSFAVSFSVGVIFGTAPALHAARLDPVEALRYE